MQYKEIEVRFLEIKKEELLNKLKDLGAQDKGSDTLKETIFYDDAKKFIDEHKFIRIRENKNGALLTYKQHMSKGKDISGIDDVDEVETKVDDPEAMKVMLEKVGFEAFREQEKHRHSFVLDEVMIEIDEWPKIPVYMEMEGPSEEALKAIAEKLGLNWKDAYFGSARDVIEKVYNMPVMEYKHFTFSKVG